MGDFDFSTLPDLPTRSKNKQNWSLLIVILLVLACVLLAANLLVEANRHSLPNKVTTTSTVATSITKREWRIKFADLTGCGHPTKTVVKVQEQEVYKVFGKPFKTQTVGDKQYWYWKCDDGIIQAISMATTDPRSTGIWFDGANDY